MSQRVVVSAPSRLHFGLAALAPHGTRRGYGGVGLMIDAPRLELTFQPANQFTVRGAPIDRVRDVADRCAAVWGLARLPLAINVEHHIPLHSGLGQGTQLALSVARGLAQFLGRDDPSAIELAKLTDRGHRSAVGTYGNLHGGLIVDAGKICDEELGQLHTRVTVPDEWRILLARPSEGTGACGQAEQRAFASLPPICAATTDELMRIATECIAPACACGDFATFAASVHRYGQLAGECFAPCQGGVYGSPEIAEVADMLANAGAQGVGQSSWGPTVFGLAASPSGARTIAERCSLNSNLKVQIARPDDCGLVVNP